MTQEELKEFKHSLDSAKSWIQMVHERLQQNDNTQGPREGLEARVRATEEICESEEEGRIKVDFVMAAAEPLLRTSTEEDKAQICTELKELKALWEETSTYMIHCHSRVEWVWLHWGEYLKAYEELWAWLLRMGQALAPEPELQLGLREKLWQLEHHRVLLEDTQHHASHLGRLLEEAEALHVRTEDESVGQEAQKDLEGAYNKVLEQAKVRVSLLERIVDEQRAYDNLVGDFRSWLASQSQKMSQALDAEDLVETKVKILQELYAAVSSREGALSHIESVAIGVKHSSSPGGAEQVAQETEALRAAWERLRERLSAEQEALDEQRQSREACVSLADQLEKEVTRIRAQTQRCGRELKEDGGKDGGEKGLLDAWRKATDILSAMETEEPSVERLKVELKKLFRYSHDATSLSDRVLACIKEFQGVKSQALRMRAQREASLTKHLRDLLQDHSRWSQMATKILQESLEPIESRHVGPVLQNVERLLEHRHHLQDRQRALPLQQDSLHSVYGPQKSQSLLKELSLAFKTREELYEKLQQRKARLQVILSDVDQFDKGYESISKHLDPLRERLNFLGPLQPHLLAKRNQNEQLQVILAELEAMETDFSPLEVLVSDNPANLKRLNLLHAEWRNVLSSAKLKLNESAQNVTEHEEFNQNLLDLEDWLKAMQGRLSDSGPVPGDRRPDNGCTDTEMGDLLAKEMQLHQTEALGQRVMAKTSKDGQGQILQALQRLRESWNSIHSRCVERQKHLLLAETATTPSVAWTSEGGSSEDPGLIGLDHWNAGARDGDEGMGGITGHNFSNTTTVDAYQSGIQEVGGQGLSQLHAVSGGGGLAKQQLGNVETAGGFPLGDISGSALRHRKPAEAIGGLSQTTLSFEEQLASDERGSGQGQTLGGSCKHREAFEAWLKNGNAEFSKISNRKGPLSTKEQQARQQKLQELRADLGHGRNLFQRMISAGTDGPVLEDLRYHWMLYKTKLQDCGDIQAQPDLKVKVAFKQKSIELRKAQKSGGGFLQRVCCAALPLQLLLLSLLLLAFLLPLTEDSASCSLVNNFARSFKVMLRHDGLPPT